MTLWRALLEGVGWRLGREAAEDAIRSLKGDGGTDAEKPVETPEQREKRLERELRAAEKAAAEAKRAADERKKAAEKKKQADAREVESELAQLKKQLKKDR